MDFQPLINGKSYSWADITFNIGGVPVAGITKISYKVSQEKQNNYGAGSEPVSRGKGNREYEASITLHMEEVERLLLAAPNRDLLKIPAFDINITYQADPTNIANHVLKNCEFTEDGTDIGQGDQVIEIELPLSIAGIQKGL